MVTPLNRPVSARAQRFNGSPVQRIPPTTEGMGQFQPILISGLTGFVSGLLLSIPVGPVNLTIMNEGARRGFYLAMMIGLGATTMEVIYCFIAFTGFAS